MHAFKLYTGEDNASHVLEGTLTLDQRTDVIAAHFKESPPHSFFDWHDAPETQYVITLTGTLEFTTRDSETSIIRPRDVLVAPKWRRQRHRWRRSTTRLAALLHCALAGCGGSVAARQTVRPIRPYPAHTRMPKRRILSKRQTRAPHSNRPDVVHPSAIGRASVRINRPVKPRLSRWQRLPVHRPIIARGSEPQCPANLPRPGRAE
jgi:hypothetical protein